MVHRDRTRGETTGFEKVLDKTMTGKDMGIEAGQATLAQLAEGKGEHRLTDPDFTRRMINEKQTDCAHLSPFRLRKQILHPGEKKAHDDVIDSPDHENRVGLVKGTVQGFGDGFGQPISQRPHRVEGFHLRLQTSVKNVQVSEVLSGCQSSADLHHDFRPKRRRIPHKVTSNIASRTISGPIFESPRVRSRKMIGTSVTVSPESTALIAIST